MKEFTATCVLVVALATLGHSEIPAQESPKPMPEPPKKVKVVYLMPKHVSLKVTEQWADLVPDKSLRAIVPNGKGVITDELTWLLVWSAWTGGGNPPQVNFKEEILLVFTSYGPNYPCLNLYRSGKNVIGSVGHTLKGGPGFGYRILKVSRKEIQFFFGEPIE
jgi:hypothetical protein